MFKISSARIIPTTLLFLSITGNEFTPFSVIFLAAISIGSFGDVVITLLTIISFILLTPLATALEISKVVQNPFKLLSESTTTI